jgi:hypothetical protein
MVSKTKKFTDKKEMKLFIEMLKDKNVVYLIEFDGITWEVFYPKEFVVDN